MEERVSKWRRLFQTFDDASGHLDDISFFDSVPK